MPKVSEEVVKKTFQDVIELLEGMLNDRSVPRNIKRVAQRSINELSGQSGETPGIVASNVIYYIDDLSQDPNIPFHSRSTIYRIISMLEPIKD